MPDKDKKEEEVDAASIFPFKVKIQGVGTVTPPGGIRPNGKRVPLPEENDNG
jgi:hypothetical protein